ncbi:ABC transporter permease [Lamprobacter modestohalophilus]|uniref:ABC transporter permease subunit n=1 Tax=Lamprobacter modestohalophilus TaxID=1064514 RepID=UPI002ADEC8C1|nr:ABC transporter permease subunit [Lamprobacter modestohalophilus]MEA1048295.1 ABC transporter permease [Lamprobacter modestohalophilus]
MILVIARRELAAVFQTPLAWMLLAATQLLLAWVFLEVIDQYQGIAAPELEIGFNAALAERLYGATLMLLLLIAPLLAARSLGQDRQLGTDQLLGSAPVRISAILLGKLIALLAPLWLLALLPLLLVAWLVGASPVDLGLFLAATLGLCLSALLFASVGLLTASLVRQPTLAAILAYALLIMLSLIHDADQLAALQLSLLDWLSWSQHLVWLFNGVARLSDLSYFVLMSALFLALTERQLANRQLG